MPGMLFDGSKGYEMKQRCSGGIDTIVKLAPFHVCEADGFDESWRAFQILLKEHRGIDATRPSLQYGWPIFQVRQQVSAHPDVITEKIEFCYFFIRPIDAIERCQRN